MLYMDGELGITLLIPPWLLVYSATNINAFKDGNCKEFLIFVLIRLTRGNILSTSAFEVGSDSMCSANFDSVSNFGFNSWSTACPTFLEKSIASHVFRFSLKSCHGRCHSSVNAPTFRSNFLSTKLTNS